MAEHPHYEHLHPHAHSHDHVAANREYFNKTAQKYDERPDAQELARRLAAVMRKAYPDLFDEDNTTMMEYACGTGMISRELCPYVKSIVGVDISNGMVDQFNRRALNQGLTTEEMKAVCTELKGNEQELDGRKFDVIVCSMSYHHFPSIEDVTRLLAFFLKPGGSLVVADIMKSSLTGEIFPQNTQIVPNQHGFSERDMRATFAAAGLTAFDFALATSGKLHSNNVDFFLARGVKPHALA